MSNDPAEPDDSSLDESILELYHENSKLTRNDIGTFARIASINSSAVIRQTISKPPPGFRRSQHTRLPELVTRVRDLGDLIRQRRSVREFSGQSVSVQQLSNTLQIGDGLTGSIDSADGAPWLLRSAPSPGGLFPTRMFCVTLGVDGMTPGLYYYNVQATQVELLQEREDLRTELSRITAMEATFRGAAFCCILTCHLGRLQFKYGERSYRFALLEAGHIAQNLLLGAEYEGLGAVAIGGFIDDEVNQLCELRGGEEFAVYLVAVGHRVKS